MSRLEFCPRCGHRKEFHHGENGACVFQWIDTETGEGAACGCTYYADQEKGGMT